MGATASLQPQQFVRMISPAGDTMSGLQLQAAKSGARDAIAEARARRLAGFPAEARGHLRYAAQRRAQATARAFSGFAIGRYKAGIATGPHPSGV